MISGNMKAKVSAVVCKSYDKEEVYSAVKTAVDSLGGIRNFVKPEERILVKPNFLSPAEAEKVITTHPSVISAVLRILQEEGYGKIKVGDSPANGTCRAALGKLELSEDDLYGAEIAEMNEEVLTQVKNGMTAKELYFTKDVVEANAIIGVCKMKTHALERITGAVKNMFGLICGRRKAASHVKWPTASEFAKMLSDIHTSTPQRLHIMDAVVAMEGNGPASGTPVSMNLILASAEPVALDTVFRSLINLSPALVPTNVMGSVAGLGTMAPGEIDVILTENGSTVTCSVEELAEKYGNPDFDVAREKEKPKTLLSFFSGITGGGRRPYINKDKCVKCGVCVDHCPVDGKGVRFSDGRTNPPVYDYSKCIRCYCCQELCPQHAISVKKLF